MEGSDVRRAVDAGAATAAALGLPVNDVTVVNNSNRMALRLSPCDVLARVAPLENLAGAEFEVEVARRLVDVGAPVADLEPRVEARVYVRDSFAISLWTYYEPVAPEVAAADYAEALMRHHAALRQLKLTTPHYTDRVAEAVTAVSDQARTPELRDSDRDLLKTTLLTLGAHVSSSQAGDQLLHGEPHPGNLLATTKGPLFVDLDTCCRGPVEFDVAHAPEEVWAYYPRADPDFVHRCHVLMWAMVSAWRWCEGDRYPDGDHWKAEGLNRVRTAIDSYRIDLA